MRVPRYFAFVDLCGFTRFTDAHGDEQAVDVLTRFRSAVREIASDHGVRVAKWLGDGAMFVSTDPRLLVEGVCDLTRRSDELDIGLPLRAGIAGGEVILFEGDDYIGGDVNLAARLCDAAAPHEVLSTKSMVASLDGVERVDVGMLSVSGFVHPVEVVRLESLESTEVPSFR